MLATTGTAYIAVNLLYWLLEAIPCFAKISQVTLIEMGGVGWVSYCQENIEPYSTQVINHPVN